MMCLVIALGLSVNPVGYVRLEELDDWSVVWALREARFIDSRPVWLEGDDEEFTVVDARTERSVMLVSCSAEV